MNRYLSLSSEARQLGGEILDKQSEVNPTENIDKLMIVGLLEEVAKLKMEVKELNEHLRRIR